MDHFVNADVIARGLSAFNPEAAAFQAGRVMLLRLRELAQERIDFAFETTLASRVFAPWLAALIESGYVFTLIYVWVKSPDLCIDRVARRVSTGGHHVPDDVVRRRYFGGLRNFFTLYRPLAETWKLADNSEPERFHLVADGCRDKRTSVYDETGWSLILRQVHDADR